jgi:serine/threonine-protein phosphatase CPPED1
MRPLLLVLAFLAMLLPATAESQQPWFFAVLSDPQFGMYAKDQNFAQETANFEFAIANLNQLHPRFVVVCGDLVNRSGDPAEIAEYKRILQKLDTSIPVYSVAGNHDVGNVPTPATLDGFHAAIGRDYYTFSLGEIFGVVLDSNLIRSPEGDPEAARQQEEWLERTMASAKSKSNQQIVVFQHIPYFVQKPDEADGYFNIPQPARRRYLDMLEKAGVRYVFAGHTHKSSIGIDGLLTEIVTGAVGMPLGGSSSGFRIVAVAGQKFDSTWFCFGGIPNQIDAHSLASTHCQQ